MTDTAPTPADDKAPQLTIPSPPKRGRGRPAKEDTAPRTVKPSATPTADVKKAMSTLDSAYTMIATGLMVLGLDKTAAEWVDTSEQLNKTNEAALIAAPKLAKRIASAGETGGGAQFFVTHALAIAGVVRIAQGELTERRIIAAEAAAQAAGGADVGYPSTDVG